MKKLRVQCGDIRLTSIVECSLYVKDDIEKTRCLICRSLIMKKLKIERNSSTKCEHILLKKVKMQIKTLIFG